MMLVTQSTSYKDTPYPKVNNHAQYQHACPLDHTSITYKEILDKVYTIYVKYLSEDTHFIWIEDINASTICKTDIANDEALKSICLVIQLQYY